MTLRSLISNEICRVSWYSGVSTLRARLQGATRILMFHEIDGEQYRDDVFEAQIRYLKERFSIIPISVLLDPERARNGSAARSIVLTFDDGLRNHSTTVYPILKQLNVPATFYVCPALIEEGRWLWNHEARERLRSLAPQERAELQRALGAPTHEVEGVVVWMKSLRQGAREQAERTIRTASATFRPNPLQHRTFDIMSWEELRALDPDLITIGSHSSTHPILTSIAGEEAEREIVESQKWLEDKLGRPVEHFCYPNGRNDSTVERFVRAHYRTAVTTEAGFAEAGGDPFRLRRINVPDSTQRLAWKLHRPHA